MSYSKPSTRFMSEGPDSVKAVESPSMIVEVRRCPPACGSRDALQVGKPS